MSVVCLASSRVRTFREAFDTAAVIEALRADNPAVGAIASFIGLMALLSLPALLLAVAVLLLALQAFTRTRSFCWRWVVVVVVVLALFLVG